MTLESALGQLDLLLLLFVRMNGLFITAPVWSNRLVPVQLRVALSFVMALLVLPLLPATHLPTNILELAPLIVKELLIGAIIGFTATLIFSAVHLAGELLDIDMGLSIMNVIDPFSGTQMPLIGNFKYLLALLVYLAVGGHHALIVAAVRSYQVVPLGGLSIGPQVFEAMMALASGVFAMALRIALPVLGALFLTTVALGVVNRAVPQMNVFVVGLPVKLAAGVLMLAAGLPFYVSFLEFLFDQVSAEASRMLVLLKG